MSVLVYNSPSRDAAYNLALEERLFEAACRGTVSTPLFLTYQNSGAVVVGRNQNVYREIDALRAESAGIPVLRRISGGGAVYHGPGNINYALILRQAAERRLDYAYYLQPLLDFLASLGLKAKRCNNSDIFLNKQKISGNAQHQRGNFLLHHGTLLYDADLETLRGLLTPGRPGFCSRARAVPSRPSPVGLIRPALDEASRACDAIPGCASPSGYGSAPDLDENVSDSCSAPDLDGFLQALTAFLAARLLAIQAGNYPGETVPDWGLLSLKTAFIRETEALAANKYQSFAWNYGRSPSFVYTRAWKEDGENWALEAEITNALIKRFCLWRNGSVWPSVDSFNTLALLPFLPSVLRLSLCAELRSPERAEVLLRQLFGV